MVGPGCLDSDLRAALLILNFRLPPLLLLAPLFFKTSLSSTVQFRLPLFFSARLRLGDKPLSFAFGPLLCKHLLAGLVGLP